VRDGFLVADGLVPASVTAAAEAVLWDAIAGVVPTWEGDPHATGGRFVGGKERKVLSRAEVLAGAAAFSPENAVQTGWVGMLDHPAILAVVTPAYIRAAEQLGIALHRQAGRPLAMTDWAQPASRLVTINSLPAAPGTEWTHPEGHTDLGVNLDRTKGGDGIIPVSVQSIAYVQSAGRLGGGGTVCWPQTHRLLRESAGAEAWAQIWQEPNPAKQYERLQQAFDNESDKHAELNAIVVPVEVTPLPGAVLFYDMLCMHTGSTNVSGVPRLALSMKWPADYHTT
jgi:hypothetical protein